MTRVRCLNSILFFIVFTIGINQLNAQLVNIEARRIQSDSVRFVLTDIFSFSHNDKNGKTLMQISNTLATQYKTKNLKNIFLGLGSYKLIRTADEDFLNVLFGHLRYNRKITKVFRIESFIQYQRNPVLDISARELVGAGVRFKVVSSENFWAYVGTTYMYEHERSDKYEQTNTHHRSSNYVSLTSSIPNSGFIMTGTMYYQPEYKNLDDFRVLAEIKLKYKINKHVSFNSGYNYFYDHETPMGGRQYYGHTKIGVGLSW